MISTSRAGCSAIREPVRVFATGVVAMHEGLREFGDVDNGVATCEFEGGKMACFYASRTMAHGHDTQTEMIRHGRGADGRPESAG